MVVPGGWVVPTSVMFPQVYFTHPCSAVGRSVNGRPKPTMPFVPLVPIYLPTNRLPAASLPTPAMPTSFDSSRAAYCPGLPGRVSATLSVSVVPAMAAPVLPVPQ